MAAIFAVALLSHACTAQLVTTLAGGGSSGQEPGFQNGVGTSALFQLPGGAAISIANRKVYVCDMYNNALRAVTLDGTVTTIAGGGHGAAGSQDGMGTAAGLNGPSVAATSPAWAGVFFSDQYNHKLRFCNPVSGSVCEVRTAVGGGATGSQSGSVDGEGTAALFSYPFGVAISTNGNIFVADTENCKIRFIVFQNDAFSVTTLAGGGAGGTDAGSADGLGTAALFQEPCNVACDAAGAYVYVADTNNNKVRVIEAASGMVTTLAGGGASGTEGGASDGVGTAALISGPQGIALDEARRILYVADVGNNKLRAVTLAGVVTTLAGGGVSGTDAGYTDGYGTAALFSWPFDVSFGGDILYVADFNNNKIRAVALLTPTASHSPSPSFSLSATPTPTPTPTPSSTPSGIPRQPPAAAAPASTAPAIAGACVGALALAGAAFALGVRIREARQQHRGSSKIDAAPLLFAASGE